MTASHPGGLDDSPPDIVANGGLPRHSTHPARLIAARRQVAAIAAAAALLIAGWTGRDYLIGSWRYLAEHRSPLAPGLLCPTLPGQAMPGPGLLATITDLGRGVPPAAVANQYGCAPASSFVEPEPEPSAPPPRSERIPRGAA
jgi:hypothetical protein